MIDIRALREDPAARQGRAGAPRGRGVRGGCRPGGRRGAARHGQARRKTSGPRSRRSRREVGQARKAGDGRPGRRAQRARAVRWATKSGSRRPRRTRSSEQLRNGLLYLPNIPADDAPDGDGRGRQRRGPPLVARPGPRAAGAADAWSISRCRTGRSARPSRFSTWNAAPGSPVRCSRSTAARGARCCARSTAFAIDRHSPEYEEILPPTVVLTDTMTSTGHLPKFADDAYHIERDDLWLIPTAEVPLTSMHRGEILEESHLPIRFTAATACYRREAGSAGRDTRGLLRVHEFYKVELFAYGTPDGALEAQADILRRAESMLQELELPYRVLDLCTGDLGGSSARTFDLEVYSPGRRPLARGLVGQLVPRLPGPPGQCPVPAGGRRTAAARAHRQRLGAGLAPHLGRADGERTTGRRDRDAARGVGAVSGWRAVDQGAVSAAGRGRDGGFGFDDAVDAIAAESRRLADVVASADLNTRVPTTPKWSVRDLAHHVGTVQWYWSAERAGQEPGRTFRGLLDPAAARQRPAGLARLVHLLAAQRVARRRPGRAVLGLVDVRHRTRRGPLPGIRPRRWPSTAGTRRARSGSPAPACRRPSPTDGVPEFIEIMVGADVDGSAAARSRCTAIDTGGAGGSAARRRRRSRRAPPSSAPPRRTSCSCSTGDCPVPDADVVGDPMLVAALLSLADTS